MASDGKKVSASARDRCASKLDGPRLSSHLQSRLEWSQMSIVEWNVLRGGRIYISFPGAFTVSGRRLILQSHSRVRALRRAYIEFRPLLSHLLCSRGPAIKYGRAGFIFAVSVPACQCSLAHKNPQLTGRQPACRVQERKGRPVPPAPSRTSVRETKCVATERYIIIERSITSNNHALALARLAAALRTGRRLRATLVCEGGGAQLAALHDRIHANRAAHGQGAPRQF